jgi:predicted enzyme related to lactoylglutathione lyase
VTAGPPVPNRQKGRIDVVNPHGHFAWYELMTTDVEAATAFYTKVVGWNSQDASAPGSPYTLLGVGRSPVGGLMRLPDEARKTGAKPRWVGYIGVDDVDATAARIERLGGTIHVPPTDVPEISRISIVADPQSAVLALIEWVDPDHQQSAPAGTPGRVGWHELLAADWTTAFAFYAELFGWKKAESSVDTTGIYQLFSVGGQTIGGMFTKPAAAMAPFWLFYFNVGDVDAAAQRAKAAGGEILEGPLNVQSGAWVVRCADPQGAMFALIGQRSKTTVGYFEPAAVSGPAGRRWSW